MKLHCFLALLLVTFVGFSLARAESAVEETEHHGLKGSQTNEEAKNTNTGSEERTFSIPGFNKLKGFLKKSGGLANKAGALKKDPKLVNSLQKNAEFMKSLEHLKKQPKVLDTVKSLQKNPKAVEAIQKAPVTEANFKKIEEAVTSGKKKGHYQPIALFYLVTGLLVLGVVGLAAFLSTK